MRTKGLIGGLMIVLLPAATMAAGGTDVVEAVKQGNRAAVRALLAKSADVRAAEPDGTTALHWAVRANDQAITQLLLRAGANANAKNEFGVTPLSLAATNGSPAMIEMLVKAGADPKATVGEGETILMTAARSGNPEAVKTLVLYGAQVNAKEQWQQQTALMWAANENHAAAVKVLVEVGADLELHGAETRTEQVIRGTNCTCPRGGFTALMFATRQGAMDAMRVLVEARADVNASDPDGINALQIAIINGEWDAAAFLLENGADPNQVDNNGRAALFTAVDMHSLEWSFNRPYPKQKGKANLDDIIGMLLDYGADVNNQISNRPLPSKYTARGNSNLIKGATPFLKAASTADVPMMRLLLKWGADPFVVNQAHTNAIMAAAGLGWSYLYSRGPQEDAIEAIQMLLDLGMDVNAFNDNGETALLGAAERTPDQESATLIQFLVSKGADLTAKNKKGETAYSKAAGTESAGGGLSERLRNHKVQELLAGLLGMNPTAQVQPAR